MSHVTPACPLGTRLSVLSASAGGGAVSTCSCSARQGVAGRVLSTAAVMPHVRDVQEDPGRAGSTLYLCSPFSKKLFDSSVLIGQISLDETEVIASDLKMSRPRSREGTVTKLIVDRCLQSQVCRLSVHIFVHSCCLGFCTTGVLKHEADDQCLAGVWGFPLETTEAPVWALCFDSQPLLFSDE